MKTAIALGLILLLICNTAVAQDSTKKGNLTITGSVDGYYRYNFDNAKDSGRTNNYTSFTHSQNSFELGMASLKAGYTIRKIAAVADLGFGKRAEEFSYNDEGTMATIRQAFVSYSPSDKVKFIMGKWFTHIGYEVPDAHMNRNYSMDYMFSFGPFFLTGIKMDATLNSNFGFMVGVANPTDFSTASFAKKNFLAQVHLITSDSKLNGYLNYLGGKDMSDAVVNQFEAVISAVITTKFNIGYNGSIKLVEPAGGSNGSWWGSALYFNYDPSSVFGLTARGEYFADEDGVAGFGTDLYDLTLSGNIHIDNLTLIPEFRIDGAKDPAFYKDTDGLFPSAKSTGTFLLGAVFHF